MEYGEPSNVQEDLYVPTMMQHQIALAIVWGLAFLVLVSYVL